MTMETFTTHVHMLLDNLIVVGEVYKESKVIFIVISGLGVEYAPFVTSLSTRFDFTITFFDLQALLMDQEMELTLSVDSTIVVNVATVANVVPAKSGSVLCQICSCKDTMLQIVIIDSTLTSPSPRW